MSTSAIKNKLYQAIQRIEDDSLLEALLTLLNKNTAADYSLTEDDIRIIEERKSDYEKGKVKTLSVKDVKKKILRNLGK